MDRLRPRAGPQPLLQCEGAAWAGTEIVTGTGPPRMGTVRLKLQGSCFCIEQERAAEILSSTVSILQTKKQAQRPEMTVWVAG